MISFDEAFEWFYAFQRPIRISREEIFLVQMIDQKIINGKYSEAYRIIRYLKSYQSIRTTGDERGEAWLKCARAYYKMRNPIATANSLKMAEKEFSPITRERWVIRWLLGMVQWEIENDNAEALISWNEALEGFRELVVTGEIVDGKNRADWYIERIMDMMNCIEEKIFETFS